MDSQEGASWALIQVHSFFFIRFQVLTGDATRLEGLLKTNSSASFTTYGKYLASESAQLCTPFDTERLKTLHDQACQWKSPGRFQSKTRHRTSTSLSHRDNR